MNRFVLSRTLKLTLGLLAVLLVAACGTTGSPGDDGGGGNDNGDGGTGALSVAVSGLPAGTGADIVLSGPDGFNTTLSASRTLTDLAPGVYFVQAKDVAAAAGTYAPVTSGSPATVAADETTTVTVDYTFLDPAALGALNVEIVGLPAPLTAQVSVSGVGYDRDLTESEELTGLLPGYYLVEAFTVVDGDERYQGSVEYSRAEDGGNRALVLPEETTTATVTYRRVVLEDGDSSVKPAAHVQFRATSGAPVWLDAPLFNEGDPLDVKGLQYRNVVSIPGDEADYLRVDVQHGEAPSTTVKARFECPVDAEDRSLLRVVVTGEEIGHIRNLTCGDDVNITFTNRGGSGSYLFTIEPILSEPVYAEYVLSLNGHCFQQCNYQPLAD